MKALYVILFCWTLCGIDCKKESKPSRKTNKNDVTSEVFYTTEKDISPQLCEEHVSLTVLVAKVIDGDTIYCRHMPGATFGESILPSNESWRKGMKNNTITVRLAHIDAPETPRYGLPGQPFAQESTLFVKDRLLNRVVYLKLLGKDIYGRVLGEVTYQRDGSDANIAMDLIENGLAAIYRGRFAPSVTEELKKLYEALEAMAKRNKVGIWSLKDSELESPATYRRRRKEST